MFHDLVNLDHMNKCHWSDQTDRFLTIFNFPRNSKDSYLFYIIMFWTDWQTYLLSSYCDWKHIWSGWVTETENYSEYIWESSILWKFYWVVWIVIQTSCSHCVLKDTFEQEVLNHDFFQKNQVLEVSEISFNDSEVLFRFLSIETLALLNE